MTKLPETQFLRESIKDQIKQVQDHEGQSQTELPHLQLTETTQYVFSLDTRWQLRTAMPSFQVLCQRTEAQLKGAGWRELVADVPALVLQEIEQTVLKQEAPWRGILPVRTAQGIEWFDVFVRATYRQQRVSGTQWLLERADVKLAERAQTLYQNKNLQRQINYRGWASLAVVIASAAISAWLISSWSALPIVLVAALVWWLQQPAGRYAEQIRHLDAQRSPIQRRLFADPSSVGTLLYELALRDSSINAITSRLDKGTDALSDVLGNTRRRSESTLDTTQTTAAAIEQMAAAMEEMSQTVQEIAHSAADASSLTEETRTRVHQAVDFIKGTSGKMTELVAQVATSSETTRDLVARSEQVRQVSQQIDAIAEQTNLLALNAAIEAARAGDSGRGFSVVADEVRQLSQRTQQAVDEIDETITGMASAMQAWETEMQAQKSLAEECGELGEQSRAEMTEMASSIDDIGDRMMQIATAAEEHSTAVVEVRDGVHAVDENAKKTHELALGNAADVQSVETRVREFRSLVAAFEDDD